MRNEIETVISKLDISEEDASRLARILGQATGQYLEEGQEKDLETCLAWSQTFKLYALQKIMHRYLTPADRMEMIGYLAQAKATEVSRD